MAYAPGNMLTVTPIPGGAARPSISYYGGLSTVMTAPKVML
jgi:hypothetical protein